MSQSTQEQRQLEMHALHGFAILDMEYIFGRKTPVDIGFKCLWVPYRIKGPSKDRGLKGSFQNQMVLL